MTRTPKVLAEGQLPSSKGTLYTVPANTTVYISMIRMTNTSATTQTVLIYYKPGSTSRLQFYVSGVEQYNTVEKSGGDILETGDLIEGYTTTASVVDYVIMGVEES
jgi:hypothetical protein